VRFICSHDEDHRCHRLLTALEFISTNGPKCDVFRDIHAIEDYKGDLVVHWAARPSEAKKRHCQLAWVKCGELAVNVHHFLPGEMFCGCGCGHRSVVGDEA
jgi:hypothetical protein